MTIIPDSKRHNSIVYQKVSSRQGEARASSLMHFFILLSALGVITTGVIFIYSWLCCSDFFQITTIQIEGCRMTAKSDILEMSTIDIHTNLLAMDPGRVEIALKQHPWVDEVKICRHFPSRLTILITEKKPAALASMTDGLYYLDNTGSTIAPVVLGNDLDFPVITGVRSGGDAGILAAGMVQPVRDALSFLDYAGRGNPILPKQSISEIHLTEDDEMILYLLDRAFPIHLGKGTDIRTKYRRLSHVLKELYNNSEFSTTAFIRMNYMKDKVLVSKSA